MTNTIKIYIGWIADNRVIEKNVNLEMHKIVQTKLIT